MCEHKIKFEAGDFFVFENASDYTVYKNGATHAKADSSYSKNADGLSIAVARAKYLAQRSSGRCN